MKLSLNKLKEKIFSLSLPNKRKIDLARIEMIREGNLDELSDPAFLESELLPRLGFNNECLHEFPGELHKFCGSGLFSWQYPNQFSKYLVFLSRFKISSYLEIGMRWGGTFIITVEYLSRFHPIKRALGIDLVDNPSIRSYRKMNSSADFMVIPSHSEEFKKWIKKQDVFDLVLIDGDHSESGCQSDFEVVKDRFNICVFHDIQSDVCSGVGTVWKNLKSKYADSYHFIEFNEQYKNVWMQTGKKYLGIGVAVKNDFYKMQNIRESSLSGVKGS